MDAPQSVPVLGTWGFMKGRASEVIPLLLESSCYTAWGCFRRASPAHPTAGCCGGSCALHHCPVLPASPNLTQHQAINTLCGWKHRPWDIDRRVLPCMFPQRWSGSHQRKPQAQGCVRHPICAGSVPAYWLYWEKP